MTKSREEVEDDYHQELINQLTFVASLLGGFSFGGFVVLISNTNASLVTDGSVAVSIVTTCVLVVSSVIGAFHKPFHKVYGSQANPPRVFFLWYFMILLGVLLFFLNLGFLGYLFADALWLKAIIVLLCGGSSLVIVHTWKLIAGTRRAV